jgi:dihydrodipicolinate synthase/N-acetylneuraminate lyase
MHYQKHEAKDWAKANMKGVCNVIMPTFTSDLKRLNEAAIRHDVRRNIELGFWGTLVVSECGTTMDEYKRFLEIVIDEASGRQRTVIQASFDTLDDMIEVCKFGESAGADVVLPSYPPSFYPRSQQDIYDFTAKLMDSIELATIIFSVHQWNFGRLHPADIAPEIIAKLADLPNAVAVKAEGGPPGNGALVQALMACGDKVILSDPREYNSPAWVKFFGMQWMGTSNFEAFGSCVPRYFQLMHEGRWGEAMDIYWKIQPIRTTRLADMATFAGANFIHRPSWKYQGWLNGYNGGPLRQPVMKLSDHAAHRLRDAMIRAGTIPSDSKGDVGEYFVGRNPA